MADVETPQLERRERQGLDRPRGPFWLSGELVFPPPELADENGLLALGGDLRPERLLLAYSQGIFPWPLAGEGFPMMWWSPDPRFVLLPEELKVGRSLKKVLRRDLFELRFDSAFAEVISACASVARPGQGGTWITAAMQQAYVELNRLGWAHSVEAYRDGGLVGGLYGVAIGGAFFGESMFARAENASKVAFVALVERLVERGFGLIDCQQETEHLARFGARTVPLPEFLRRLAAELEKPPGRGSWSSR